VGCQGLQLSLLPGGKGGLSEQLRLECVKPSHCVPLDVYILAAFVASDCDKVHFNSNSDLCPGLACNYF